MNKIIPAMIPFTPINPADTFKVMTNSSYDERTADKPIQEEGEENGSKD